MRLWLLLLTWSLTTLATAAPLRILVDEASVEYGKPFWVTLQSDQPTVSLADIDFTAWQDDVMVIRQQDVQHNEATGIQRLRLRLYPRREGQLNLPGLFFAGVHASPLQLTVTQPVDSKTQQAIEFACQTSTTAPYQQQQVKIACQAGMQAKHVLFEYPVTRLRGAELFHMQVVHELTSKPGKPRYRHHVGWVVIPAHHGQQQFELPPIYLVRDGVITHRFYLPRLKLDVQTLPVYLPGTVPVGAIRVTHYGLVETLLSPDTLAALELRLQVEGVPVNLIPDYASNLHSNSQVQFYAAKTRYEQRVDKDGLHQNISYSIPLVARTQGWFRIPALRLQYFEPINGTIKSIIVPGQGVLILGVWVRLGVAVLMLALGVVILRVIYVWLRRVVVRFRTYRAALAQLGQTPSQTTIKQAMRLMAQAEGWSGNLTYRQWYEKMQCKVRAAHDLPFLQLYEVSYAGVAHDLYIFRETLQHLCRQRLCTILFN